MSDLYRDTQIDYIIHHLNAGSPRHALELLAQDVADKISYQEHSLFQRLIDKEEITSSAIGDGVAIPHLKIRHLENPFTALAVLNRPLDFKALDRKSVDLICLVLSPERDGPLHLRKLSRISRMFKNKELCDRIREAKDEQAVRSLLIGPEGWMLAA